MNFTEEHVDLVARKVMAAVPSGTDLLSQLGRPKISSAHVECQLP